MSMLSLTYKKARAKAEHLKALGLKDLYLDGGPADHPWHIAESCEPGNSHRLDIATSVWFRGRDPETGLTFRWSFDIEPSSASGSGDYQIDAESCREVLSKLPPKAAKSFRAYLSDCAAKVAAKGDEYQRIADRQARDARILSGLAKG